MNDLEICKRIAEIEFDDLIDCYEHEFDGICIDKPMCGMVFREAYNPLTDDALCFQLMVKHEVNVDSYLGVTSISSDYTNKPNIAQVSYMDYTINKAICLTIIEANKI